MTRSQVAGLGLGLAGAIVLTACGPVEIPTVAEIEACRGIIVSRALYGGPKGDVLPVGASMSFGLTFRRPADPNGGGGTVQFDWYRSNVPAPFSTGTLVATETKVRGDNVIRSADGATACGIEYTSSFAIASVTASDDGAVFQVRVRDISDPQYARYPGAVDTLNSNQATLSVDVLAPVHLTATPGPNLIQLGWTLDPNVIGYILERSVAAGPFTELARFVGPTNTYLDQGLTQSTLYTYHLSAVNLSRASLAVGVSATTLGPVAPPPPPPPPQGWVALGGGAISQSDLSQTPSVAVDAQGLPVVAYVEAAVGDVARLWVKRFDGTDWVALGGGPLTQGSTTAASDPAVLIDGTGRLMVSWSQGDGIQQNIYVAEWDGAQWSAVGGPSQLSTPGAHAVRPSLALQPNGRVAVAWVEDGRIVVIFSTGGIGIAAWAVPHGGATGPAAVGVNAVKLAVDGAGNPVVAYTVGSGIARTLMASVGKNTGWQAFGGPVNFPVAGNLAVQDPFDLLLDGAGAPYVAFGQGTSPYAVYLRYWDGAAWSLLGNAVWSSNLATFATLAMTLRPGGAITIAVSETSGSGGGLQIREFSGIDWQGLAALSTPSASEALAVAVAGVRSPIVADVEAGPNATHLLTVRRFYP